MYAYILDSEEVEDKQVYGGTNTLWLLINNTKIIAIIEGYSGQRKRNLYKIKFFNILNILKSSTFFRQCIFLINTLIYY